jgi:hypothetical protein
MEQEVKCTSCKTRITASEGAVKFPCPKCKKTEIVRCKNCREIAAKYSCPECGFEGPN